MIFIGYDPREVTGFIIARYSITRFTRNLPIRGIVLNDLRARKLYYRPTEVRINSNGHHQLWDVISEAPMATEFAIARFLVPHLVKEGWALFVDSDVMFLRNPNELFAMADRTKAVMCVQHDHRPLNEVKMRGQEQTKYSRKNWSSVMLFNCNHLSNRKLTVELINTVPGRDLHRFCWLEDDEIGELPPEWNYLVGHSKLDEDREPALVHFTNGLPDVPGYERQEYADHWRAALPYAAGAL